MQSSLVNEDHDDWLAILLLDETGTVTSTTSSSDIKPDQFKRRKVDSPKRTNASQAESAEAVNLDAQDYYLGLMHWPEEQESAIEVEASDKPRLPRDTMQLSTKTRPVTATKQIMIARWEPVYNKAHAIRCQIYNMKEYDLASEAAQCLSTIRGIPGIMPMVSDRSWLSTERFLERRIEDRLADESRLRSFYIGITGDPHTRFYGCSAFAGHSKSGFSEMWLTIFPSSGESSSCEKYLIRCFKDHPRCTNIAAQLRRAHIFAMSHGTHANLI